MRCATLIGLLWCSAAGAQESPETFQPKTVEVVLPDNGEVRIGGFAAMHTWRDWLVGNGFTIHRCGIDLEKRSLILDLERSDQTKTLLDAGFQIVREIEADPFRTQIRTQSEFFDPGEIEAMLMQIENDHPAITHRFSVGTTHEGRTIWAIEISDNPGIDEDEPAIQFNSQHHAREVQTSHIVMDLIETLTDDYGVDSDVTDWVNRYKTVCVPMVNPDGTQHVFDVNSNWRKNRKPCTGNVGTDLNRNYPYRWGPAGCGSSASCSSISYRGPLPNSELETQSMIGLADQYHFVMATSYHSFGRFIDYPYACYNWEPGAETMPEHDVIKEMMDDMASAISSVDGVNYTSFSNGSFGPLSGDDTSWYYAHKGTYAFIVEVGTSFEPPFSEVANIVHRNRAGWRYLYDRLGGARIDVHVTGNCQPLEAEVTLTDYLFDTGELPRETFLPFGRWTFMVPANDAYTIRVTKPGFVTQDVLVAVADLPVAVDVNLLPASPPELPLFGDMDDSCEVNGSDIGLFVQAILDGPTAELDQILRGDSDENCLVDNADISPFINAALNGATCKKP
ncbi:MAG: hypothetical protein MI923_22210 [Phycisphaerales bacterium]|nr:hypothetical protein [Phycisphaerales bacterium]